MVYCEVSTEVSETAKDGTDEQKLYRRLRKPEEVAQQTEIQRWSNTSAFMVDAAGLIRRVFILPGEVSGVAKAAREKSAEVIVVGATSYAKAWRTHDQRRTERKIVSNSAGSIRGNPKQPCLKRETELQSSSKR